MKHLDLFSGIGGFALAARNVWGNDYENVGFVDYEEFCQKVLAKNFPNTKIYGDIKQFSGKGISADLITGGFPCQPFSSAGLRKGTEDDRHLWPEMLRIIREVSPRWVVGENVRGITNWNGGLVFDDIQVDLEAAGYEVLPFLLPAGSVGAPHQRYRVWFIAHLDSFGSFRVETKKLPTEGRKQTFSGSDHGNKKSYADINGIGMERFVEEKVYRESGEQGRQIKLKSQERFRGLDSFEPKLCRTLHGLPYGVDRIKALGNAIVPQVAEEIFKVIKQLE